MGVILITYVRPGMILQAGVPPNEAMEVEISNPGPASFSNFSKGGKMIPRISSEKTGEKITIWP